MGSAVSAGCLTLASVAVFGYELLLLGLRWPLGPLYLAGPLILIIRRYPWERQQPAARPPGLQVWANLVVLCYHVTRKP